MRLRHALDCVLTDEEESSGATRACLFGDSQGVSTCLQALRAPCAWRTGRWSAWAAPHLSHSGAL